MSDFIHELAAESFRVCDKSHRSSCTQDVNYSRRTFSPALGVRGMWKENLGVIDGPEKDSHER
jgi:hypothetical protein